MIDRASPCCGGRNHPLASGTSLESPITPTPAPRQSSPTLPGLPTSPLRDALRVPQHGRFYVEGCVCRSGILGCCPCTFLGVAQGAAHPAATAGTLLPLVGLVFAGFGLYSAARMLLGSGRAHTALQARRTRLIDAGLPTAQVRRAIAEQRFLFGVVGILQGAGSLALGMTTALHLALHGGFALGSAGLALLSACGTAALASLWVYGVLQSARALYLAYQAHVRRPDAGDTPFERAQRVHWTQARNHYGRLAASYVAVCGATLMQFGAFGAVAPGVIAAVIAASFGAVLLSSTSSRYFVHTIQAHVWVPGMGQARRQAVWRASQQVQQAQERCERLLRAHRSIWQQVGVLWETWVQPACGDGARRHLARAAATLPQAQRPAFEQASLDYMQQVAAAELAILQVEEDDDGTTDAPFRGILRRRRREVTEARRQAWRSVQERLRTFAEVPMSERRHAFDTVRLAFLLAADVGVDATRDVAGLRTAAKVSHDGITSPDCSTLVGSPQTLVEKMRPHLGAAFVRVALAPYRWRSLGDEALCSDDAPNTPLAEHATCCK